MSLAGSSMSWMKAPNWWAEKYKLLPAKSGHDVFEEALNRTKIAADSAKMLHRMPDFSFISLTGLTSFKLCYCQYR